MYFVLSDNIVIHKNMTKKIKNPKTIFGPGFSVQFTPETEIIVAVNILRTKEIIHLKFSQHAYTI